MYICPALQDPICVLKLVFVVIRFFLFKIENKETKSISKIGRVEYTHIHIKRERQRETRRRTHWSIDNVREISSIFLFFHKTIFNLILPNPKSGKRSRVNEKNLDKCVKDEFSWKSKMKHHVMAGLKKKL